MKRLVWSTRPNDYGVLTYNDRIDEMIMHTFANLLHKNENEILEKYTKRDRTKKRRLGELLY